MEGKSGTFDAAALAGATLAAALPIFMKEGPFDWLAGVLGTTVLLTLFAYSRLRTRDLWQTAAFSAVFAFAFLLLVGLAFEKLLKSQGIPVQWTLDGKLDSRVPAGWLLTAWIVAALGCFVVDGIAQRQRALKEESELVELRDSLRAPR